MATENLKVHIGEKIDSEEVKTLNRAEMGVMITGTPTSAQVEAQYPYVDIVQCPYCGQLGRVVLDTDFFKWFTCGNCGGSFRA